MVAVAPNRLGAPVAPVRAAAARNHVHRKIAVGRGPRRAVRRRVDQVPRRHRQRIQVRDRRAPRCVPQLARVRDPGTQSREAPSAGRVPPDSSSARLPRCASSTSPSSTYAKPAARYSAARSDASEPLTIAGTPARRAVRAIHSRQFAIAQQAHLRQEIEIVLAHRHQPRPVALQRLFEPRSPDRLQRRVEERDLITFSPQTGRRQQRLQRRIRLHLAHLLAIAVEVIRMGEQDVCHEALPLAGYRFGAESWCASTFGLGGVNIFCAVLRAHSSTGNE